jgi:hypothetical protein
MEESFIGSVAGPRTASWPRLWSRRCWRVRQRYADFGPTLAAEHLAQEGLPVSRETLRKWMIQSALWIRFFANARTTHYSAPLCAQLVSYRAAERD